jgi:hypothetical protein
VYTPLAQNAIKAKNAARNLDIDISELTWRLQSLGYLQLYKNLDADTYIDKQQALYCDFYGIYQEKGVQK